MQRQRRGGYSPPASVIEASGRGKPAPTPLVAFISQTPLTGTLNTVSCTSCELLLLQKAEVGQPFFKARRPPRRAASVLFTHAEPMTRRRVNVQFRRDANLFELQIDFGQTA